MARPARLNAEFFYHPASLRNDRRVKAIRARHGAAGYGLLLMLLELLTDADGTALATDEMELELLAGDLSCPVEDVAALVQAAEKVGFFARNPAGLLTCPQLDEWLAPVFDKRNRARIAAAAALLAQAATETGVSVAETHTVQESIEQERTGKETEKKEEQGAADAAAPAPEKKIAEPELTAAPPQRPATGGAADVGTRITPGKAAPFVPPTADELLAYMLAQRPDNPRAEVERCATKCFGYYTANGWRVGKSPMKDWRGAAQTFLADVPKPVPGAAVLPAANGFGTAYGRPQRPSQVEHRQALTAELREKYTPQS